MDTRTADAIQIFKRIQQVEKRKDMLQKKLINSIGHMTQEQFEDYARETHKILRADESDETQ